MDLDLLFYGDQVIRSEEHTSELQSQSNLVCRLLLEKKKTKLFDSPYTSKNTTNTNSNLHRVIIQSSTTSVSHSVSVAIVATQTHADASRFSSQQVH